MPVAFGSPRYQVNRNLQPLRDTDFDLLVVGGGISGTGIALDAALRGFRVALIDKGDFASGTSSASSKLIHGGLRYLEQGNVRLVGEALSERRRLLANAPHLVWPLRLIIPFYTPARLASWQWRLGLTLYDLLAGRGNLERSRPLTEKQLRRELPALRGRGLQGGAAYFDAQMDDARLCLEVAITADHQGVCLANYVEAVAFQPGGILARDCIAGVTFSIRARQVVNATGPWVDAVCRLAGDPTGPHLQPTKGVHLIVANYPELTSALLLLHPADGRVFFVLPWPCRPDHFPPSTPGRWLLIGTTDTFANDDADHLTVTATDSAYLIEGYNAYLEPGLKPEDIRGHFAGLRPLIRSQGDAPSSLSRDFRLIESPGGLLSVAGGKYTTYRRMAELTVDAVARRLGNRCRCRTRDFPLAGTPAGPWREFAAAATSGLQDRFQLSGESAWHLVCRYGRRVGEVAGYLKSFPELVRPVVDGEPDLHVEWPYQRDHEMAMTPADHLLRRTRLGLFHPDLLTSAIADGGAEMRMSPGR